MKRLNYILFLLLAASLGSFVSCGEGNVPTLDGESEKLTINFDLSDAGIVTATPSTRASVTETELLAEGTLFFVRAFTAAKNTFVDEGVYKVKNDASDNPTAAEVSDNNPLSLTRRTCNLYFLSCNSTTECPSPELSGQIPARS